jgi:hypothetical protein
MEGGKVGREVIAQLQQFKESRKGGSVGNEVKALL